MEAGLRARLTSNFRDGSTVDRALWIRNESSQPLSKETRRVVDESCPLITFGAIEWIAVGRSTVFVLIFGSTDPDGRFKVP